MQADRPEKPHRVLLLSGSDKAAASLRDALPCERFAPIDECARAADAREQLLQHEYALVIVNAPLLDASGPALAREFAADGDRGVLLLVCADAYEAANDALFGSGVLTLIKPGSAQMLMQALNLLLSMRARLHALTQKTRKLELKMEDIRVVNRAKWILIGQLKMDEAAAHRYIEKQAMNQHRTRREIAESILMTYEQ